jgi:hypothetical protein
MLATPPVPVRDDGREGAPRLPDRDRICPVCERPFVAAGRAVYCSRACQQRAYRLRRTPASVGLLAGWKAELVQRSALLAQTVYECPACEQRYLGSRRCDECRLFCRNLGLGGACAACDEIVTVAELLGLNSIAGR